MIEKSHKKISTLMEQEEVNFISRLNFNVFLLKKIGNDEIMARGTFANVRLINKMMDKVGP
jgi:hypothetical protein